MIIGIDLGTTNSLVAYQSGDGPKVIPNRLGKYLTPSVVSVDEEGQVYVGETARERMALYPDDTARERMALYPDDTASVFKRDMGSTKKFRLQGKDYTAEELSAMVLRSLKEDAQEYLKEPVEEAVISVPAYFNDAKRKATKRAGELAGLKVERIISEPTAAAISYGLYQKNANTRFLVFDLGGEDFTEILAQMFLRRRKLELMDLSPKERNAVYAAAEKCKLGFSESRLSVFRCRLKEEWIEEEITLSDFEEECEFLLERIRKPIKRSLSDANIRLSEIDQIVQVGGATRLPIVRRFVGRLFGRVPNSTVNPDQAVALGAAIQAAMKERREAIKEVILTDVCPFTLGTEVVVTRENNRIENGHFCPIIERNTVIPASRTERLYTAHDDQTKIRVNILQGESRFAANNLSLGELFIQVPKGPAGQEAVDVTYTYDINSILEVEVRVVSTGNMEKMLIANESSGMTPEEIEARMKELSYLKIPPREQEENKLLLFRSERLYEESTGDLRRKIEYYTNQFEEALHTQDPLKIEAARDLFSEQLKELEEEFQDY